MPDKRHKSEKRALLIAFLINTSFIIVELFAAWYSGSLTLLSDAMHMITDSSSILLAIIAAYVASKEADKKRTFGYQRVEVVSGFINAIFLVLIVFYIIYSAYQRIQDPQLINSEIVILIGILGLFVNLSAAYFLHGKDSINAKGAYLHLLSDVLGSVAAIISGLIIIATGFHIFDIIFAVVISILILYSIKDMLKESLNILIQGVPEDKSIEKVQETLSGLDGVSEVHHIHLWSIASEENALTAHLVIEDGYNHSDVLESSISKLEEIGIEHPTIQIETKEFSKKEHNCYE